MPISNIRGQDLLGQAFIDFMKKTGQGVSDGYGQAQDQAQFNQAFGTVTDRATQNPSLPPLSIQNLSELGTLLGTRQGPASIDLMKLLQPKEPDYQTVSDGAVMLKDGVPIFTNEKDPQEAPIGQPTTLAKLHAERAAMSPGDPRIPDWDARIEREKIGVPNYQLKQDAHGEYLDFDPKTGRLGSGKGVYAPTASEVRTQYASLDDVKKSSAKLRGLIKKGSTGPVAGRAKKLGVLFFNDKEAQSLISTAGQLRTIIYGLSGKQINEAEQAWLDREILPKITQPDENFEITLDIFEDWVSQRQGSMVSQFPGLNAGGVQEEDSDSDDPLGLFK